MIYIITNEKVSIIVPVYNAEKTLKECVNSLIKQTYSNIEIILVNDGSKDNSLKICKEFAEKDSRIIVIDKLNGGVSSARNAGLDIASGEYVMFCDSDDWVNIHWCEELYNNYIPDSLLMCDMDKKNKYDENDIFAKFDDQIELDRVNKGKFLQYYEFGIGVPWNKIFSSGIINKYHIRFPVELSLGEDLAFVIDYLCSLSGNIHILHKKIYYYRNIPNVSLSKSVPSIEQCEFFYKVLSDGIRKLNVKDEISLSIRDSIIMNDYEKILISSVKDKGISFVNLVRLYKRIFNSDVFSACCGYGVNSKNKVYNWLIRKKHPFLLAFFNLMLNVIKK